MKDKKVIIVGAGENDFAKSVSESLAKNKLNVVDMPIAAHIGGCPLVGTSAVEHIIDSHIDTPIIVADDTQTESVEFSLGNRYHLDTKKFSYEDFQKPMIINESFKYELNDVAYKSKKYTKSDHISFENKVRKRRKKNKNKKTHRKR